MQKYKAWKQCSLGNTPPPSGCLFAHFLIHEFFTQKIHTKGDFLWKKGHFYSKQDGFALMIQLGRVLGGVGWVGRVGR